MLSRYVHVPSLQCVKIACKFTERFLRNQSFCRGTFFFCILPWSLTTLASSSTNAAVMSPMGGKDGF